MGRDGAREGSRGRCPRPQGPQSPGRGSRPGTAPREAPSCRRPRSCAHAAPCSAAPLSLQCSVSCGAGTQRRAQACQRLTAKGRRVPLGDSWCRDLPGPPLVRACHMPPCSGKCANVPSISVPTASLSEGHLGGSGLWSRRPARAQRCLKPQTPPRRGQGRAVGRVSREDCPPPEPRCPVGSLPWSAASPHPHLTVAASTENSRVFLVGGKPPYFLGLVFVFVFLPP